MEAIYNPQVFDIQNESEAKSIILTPEGSTTKERWETETPFLAKDICSFIHPDENSLVLDFGCGIGRISEALITESHCNVLGLDISQSMRELSVKYVSSEKFSSVAPLIINRFADSGLKVDACVSIWVLQHCPNVEEEIRLIKKILKPGGYFYILNNISSAIPSNIGWVNDGKNILNILENEFNLVGYSQLPTEYTSEHISKNSFIGKYRNK